MANSSLHNRNNANLNATQVSLKKRGRQPHRKQQQQQQQKRVLCFSYCPTWIIIASISAAFYFVFAVYLVVSFEGELEIDNQQKTKTYSSSNFLRPPSRKKYQHGSNNSSRGSNAQKQPSFHGNSMNVQQDAGQQHKNASTRTITKQSDDVRTTSSSFSFSSSFHFDRSKAEAALSQHGPSVIRKPLTAYLEPPMKDTIPNTGNQGDPNEKDDVGIPPDFIIPLPLRTTTPQDLQQITYAKLQTCHDIPSKIPVDKGIQIDSDGNMINWNLDNDPTAPDYPQKEIPFCPVDADPFLPWIHDFFPSKDGTKINFIAQNKRRCKTGKHHTKDVKRLEPQVALIQPVSVKRINEKEVQSIAPELWQPAAATTIIVNSATNEEKGSPPRYKLATLEDSDPDGTYTRFICRFHAIDFTDVDNPRTVIIGETLSTFPFNYEFASFRKGMPTMITPRGKDSKYFWLSSQRFECNVPNNENLQKLIASGETVLSDGTATLHVDIIPIRTSARFGTNELHFAEELAGPKGTWTKGERKHLWGKSGETLVGFNATERWGNQHVLPRVEASGRWANMPICSPPVPGQPGLVGSRKIERKVGENEEQDIPKLSIGDSLATSSSKKKKPFEIAACIWSSASFKTRGITNENLATADTLQRLEEWLEYHFMVGVDHVFVYDNSGAHTNETSLAPILDRYPPSKVTRIDWPSVPCNNNVPAHDNTGERSSQYAAENSCRTRFAPYTEWIASIDSDEYLVPMGQHESLKDVVREADKKGTNILQFRSTRAKLREDCSESDSSGRKKIEDLTFLESYNCDSSPTPKPDWAERARKQLYRADHVLLHFVHYSTVTQNTIKSYRETIDQGERWWSTASEGAPSQKTTNEEQEAMMLHTKTTDKDITKNWIHRCRFDFEKKWRGCFVGFPHPNNTLVEGAHREDGMEYNCFPVERLTEHLIPKLKQILSDKKK